MFVAPFGEEKNAVIQSCSNKEQATKVLVNKFYDGVPITDIYGQTCKDSHQLKTIEIKSDHFNIFDACFSNCENLKTIVSSNEEQEQSTFYNGAFAGCTSLTDIWFPIITTHNIKNKFNVSSNAFSGCNNITIHYTIPVGVYPNQLLQALRDKFDNTGAKSYKYVATNPPGPTPTPEERSNIWAPLMGGIFGAIAFGGLTTGIVLVIKNKRNKDKNK